MAPTAANSSALIRRLVFLAIGVFVIIVILRTPAARPWMHRSRTFALDDNKRPRSRLPQRWRDFLKWSPPSQAEHYPPYGAYRDRDYDPNLWEGFSQNDDFYLNGTTLRLAEQHQTPAVFHPFSDHSDPVLTKQWRGEYKPCVGPDGKIVDAASEMATMAHHGRPEGFPEPDIGSWEAVGLNPNVCFDRRARLGPFGLSDDGASISKMDWTRAHWGKLQDECLALNKDRYRDPSTPNMKPGSQLPPDHRSYPYSNKYPAPARSRSAVLIRTWDSYEYQENDIIAIRSLVTELNLQTGGEYHVFLLVNVKDMTAPIFHDDSLYNEYLDKAVPAELRDIAILWSEQVCQEWYPKVGEWSVYYQQFMPLQWFSKTHPEFDYIWNWEMDARLIGHHYHFFEGVVDFARKQPRKYLWERNARYYIPKTHGPWQKYFEDSNALIEKSKKHQQTVWGPMPWTDEQVTFGPKPPVEESKDKFQWGVGEDADLVTLLPLWDPRETWWVQRDRVFNYPKSEESTEDREFPHIPRRVFINTLVRLSTRLLNAMHVENEAGLSMASEMWPASVSLQHGFKAVYAPHPIWQSHVWDPEYLDMVYNADGWGAGSLPGQNIDDGRGAAYSRDRDAQGLEQTGSGPNNEGKVGRWGQERDAPYSPDREHNFGGLSWYFWSDFPRIIYWRWLGWKAAFKIQTISSSTQNDDLGLAGGAPWEAEHGRLCFPHMLLHPVKKVKRRDGE